MTYLIHLALLALGLYLGYRYGTWRENNSWNHFIAEERARVRREGGVWPWYVMNREYRDKEGE